jgi:asparagine synthase (glutamine-hydrolysing)
MCGITGFWTPDGLNLEDARATVTAMTDVLRHRGPDDEGAWIDPVAGIALGFRRLAILDLTPTGHQPMESASGRFVIIFNGEIYNHAALRQELAALGHRFRGRSDTEVLLEAIEAWGLRRTLEQCNGMFAFALWDKAERTLHLARDRAGEKPLYYGWVGRTLLFGSELKALRAHPAFQAPIDRNALALYLRRGYVPSPYSIYVGVQKLPAGTWLTLRPDCVGTDTEPSTYWSLLAVAEQGVAEPSQDNPAELVETLHDLLSDAVKLRMEADVPLGAFLSGGIDSSTIVALMQTHSIKPVRTFTIGFRDPHDEARHAAAVARHLGTEHTELYVTPADALAVIPRLPMLYDEPFADTSQIPTFLVSELTRRHVTVSLSGDAGDELFGGYRRLRLGPAIWRGIRWLPLPVRRHLASLLTPPSTTGNGHRVPLLSRLTRRVTGKRNLVERLRQVAEILPLESPVAIYHYMMSFWKDPSVLLPGVREMPIPATDAARRPDFGGSPEHTMMFLDTVAYLTDDILVKLDRASMGTSLEGRVPLLDHRVIEFAWRMPLSVRLHGGKGTKWPLREVLHRYVPRTLVDRPKQGFHMPVAEWLRGPLREWAESLLDERRLRDGGMLDPGPIRQKWSEHLAGTTRWDYHLWTVLMYEAWVESASQVAQPVPA